MFSRICLLKSGKTSRSQAWYGIWPMTKWSIDTFSAFLPHEWAHRDVHCHQKHTVVFDEACSKFFGILVHVLGNAGRNQNPNIVYRVRLKWQWTKEEN
jgi:hypothetical protein